MQEDCILQKISFMGKFLSFFKVQFIAWFPAGLWCLFIFLVSTDEVGGNNMNIKVINFLKDCFPPLSSEQLSEIVFYLRKTCHVVEYMILGSFVFHGLVHSGIVGMHRLWSYRMAILTFLICCGYAATDEYHQSLTKHRNGCLSDVMIDSFGVLLAIGLMWVIAYFLESENHKKKT